MILLRIGARFYDDHKSRDLPTPVAQKRNRSSVWIDADDPAVSELLDDARYYSTPWGPGESDRGLMLSARATAKVLTAIPRPA